MDTVDQAEEALLPASLSTSLTKMSDKQGSSVAPACNFASRAPVALQQPAMVGLGEIPPVAGMPNIRHARQHMSCGTAQVCVRACVRACVHACVRACVRVCTKQLSEFR